ncbi:MAG: alanine racemase [Nitrospirota bacterium]
MNRGTVAEINVSALSHNLGIIRALAPHRPVIAVVKADAYGHGAVEVSRQLVRSGVEYLAVAFTQEARDLREADITAPLMVLFDPDPKDVIAYNLIPVVADKRAAYALSEEARRNNRTIGLHIEVDTGMGRLGIVGDAVKEILEIAALEGIAVEGIMSHFSEADLADASFARLQMERITTLQHALAARGLKVGFFHLANSAAVLSLPESHFFAVRPGLMLYGYSPFQEPGAGNRKSEYATAITGLKPVMTVKTRMVGLRKLPAGTPISYGRTFITKRESLIGVLSLGYADGFNRLFSSNAEVLVRGKRAPVVGRVCMDMTMIDVTEVEGITEHDDVTVLGKQGDESIDASELAKRIHTIPYEILLSLGSRARRIYINAA